MKDIYKYKVRHADPLAEIKSDPNFLLFSQEESTKIELGIKIYEKRKTMGISQENLAKKLKTTQRIISNIENGDQNIGINLQGRLFRFFNFNSNELAEIFYCPVVITYWATSGTQTQNVDKTCKKEKKNVLITHTRKLGGNSTINNTN